jgi:hypothetical protein
MDTLNIRWLPARRGVLRGRRASPADACDAAAADRASGTVILA